MAGGPTRPRLLVGIDTTLISDGTAAKGKRLFGGIPERSRPTGNGAALALCSALLRIRR
jgi:hypothetical protein